MSARIELDLTDQPDTLRMLRDMARAQLVAQGVDEVSLEHIDELTDDLEIEQLASAIGFTVINSIILDAITSAINEESK